MEDYELDPSELESGEEVILNGVKGTLERKTHNPSNGRYQFELENREEVFTYPSTALGFRKHSVDNVYSQEYIEDTANQAVSNAKALADSVEDEGFRELEKAVPGLED